MTWIRSSYCYGGDCVEVWRKAGRSSGNGSCVEVRFRKSRKSADTANCVEVGRCDCDVPEVLIRDSKDPDGPRLSLPPAAFNAFLADLKAGQFDRTG